MTPQLHTSLSPPYLPKSTRGDTQCGVQAFVQLLPGLVLHREASLDATNRPTEVSECSNV